MSEECSAKSDKVGPGTKREKLRGQIEMFGIDHTSTETRKRRFDLDIQIVDGKEKSRIWSILPVVYGGSRTAGTLYEAVSKQI